MGDWELQARVRNHRNLGSLVVESKIPPNGRILMAGIVDPECSQLRLALEELGLQVSVAATTTEALPEVFSRRVDLVLLDFQTPEIGAPEFCKLLRRDSYARFIPTFVLSTAQDLESEVASIEAGAQEHAVRPIRLKSLLARVQASLRRRALLHSLDDSESVFLSLAQSVEERDAAVGSHCERLAIMATAMGITLELPPDDLFALHRAGYLHDIGKVAIPDRILFKPGPLSSEEWEIMRSHSERGERICHNLRSLAPVLPIIRHHHERWDGSGYPDKLKGEQIPLLARILQLADIYDALTTERPYKPTFTPEAAIQILREEARKGWRDPVLVETFSEVLPLFRATPSLDLTAISLQALSLSLGQSRKAPSHAAVRSALDFASGLKFAGAF